MCCADDSSKYTKASSESTGKGAAYFAVGAMGALSAAGAKSVVSDFIANLSASADVLALAKVEVDLSSIPEGKNVILKVRPAPPCVDHPEIPMLMSSVFACSGVASPSSFVTAPRARSTRPTRSTSRPSVTPRPTQIAPRSPSGSSCSVSGVLPSLILLPMLLLMFLTWGPAPTWVVFPSARLVTTMAGSAHATALTTTFLVAPERALPR